MPQILRPVADVSNAGGWKREPVPDGGNPGTAQAGTANTITLAASASGTDDFFDTTMEIELTGGTGAGQTRDVSDYVGATKVLTVASNWTTNPDATTTYVIRKKAEFEAVDESTLDPSDYVESPTSPAAAKIRFRLAGGTDPNSTGLHRIHVYAQKPQAGGAQQDLTVRVYGNDDTTLIATEVFTNVSEVLTEYTFDLTVGEIGNLTQSDYENGIIVELDANQSG